MAKKIEVPLNLVSVGAAKTTTTVRFIDNTNGFITQIVLPGDFNLPEKNEIFCMGISENVENCGVRMWVLTSGPQISLVVRDGEAIIDKLYYANERV